MVRMSLKRKKESEKKTDFPFFLLTFCMLQKKKKNSKTKVVKLKQTTVKHSNIAVSI